MPRWPGGGVAACSFESAAAPARTMVRVEPDDLPDAEDLWWSWVVLAALHRAVGDETCRFEPDQVVARPRRRRRFLAADAAPTRPSHRCSGAARPSLPSRRPTHAAARPTGRSPRPRRSRRPTFLAWHAHGEWDPSAPVRRGRHPPAPAAADRRPARRRAGALGRGDAGDASRRTPTVTTSRRPSSWCARPRADGPSSARGLVGSRLRDQIHGQMRDGSETDRMLMQRPPALVQWSRINGPGVPFEYAVMAVRGRITPAPTNTRLAAPAAAHPDQRAAQPARPGGERGVRRVAVRAGHLRRCRGQVRPGLRQLAGVVPGPPREPGTLAGRPGLGDAAARAAVAAGLGQPAPARPDRR